MSLSDAAGSSVPEAARAAAQRAVWDLPFEYRNLEPRIIKAALDAAAPFIVAAAVAEERATTGRRIEALAAMFDDWVLAEDEVVWSRGYNVAIKRAAVELRRAAQASPGEGE